MISATAVLPYALWIAAISATLAAVSLALWPSRRAIPTVTSGIAARLVAWEPLIVLAMAPALLFPTRLRLVVLLGIPVMGWAARVARGRAIPPTPLNAALYLLLTMTATSVAVTFDLHNSLGKITGVLLGVLVFWAWTRWTETPERLTAATTGFLMAGLGLAVVGLLGTNWFGKFGMLAPVLQRLPRAIRGVPGAEEGFQPNAVAGCLVLFIPLQAALLAQRLRGTSWQALRGPLDRPAVQAVALALTSATLLLTQSRGAWTGLIVAGVAFLLCYQNWTRIIGGVAIGAIAIAAVALSPNRLATLAISQSGPAMTQNVSGRMELWSRALAGIQDFPVTGMGMNNFRRLMPRMYPTLDATPELDIAHAHNHLLQAALDLGVPGLIAYLAIWMVSLTLLWRVYRRAADAMARTIAGGLAAGLIAHFVFSLADVIPLGSKVGVLFWMTLALAASLHQIALPAAPAADGPQSKV